MPILTRTAARCLLSTAIIAVTTAACGNPNLPDACTTQYVYGLTIAVQDKATSQPICDATVTLVSGSYTETVKPFVLPTECRYNGAGERAGVYTITVAKDGFAVATMNNVRVDKDACHVIPVNVTIGLER